MHYLKNKKKQTYYSNIFKFESSFGFIRWELLVAIVTTLWKRELNIITIIPKCWIAAQSFASWHIANLKVQNSIVARRQPKWLLDFFFPLPTCSEIQLFSSLPKHNSQNNNYSSVKGSLVFSNSKEPLSFVLAFCSFFIESNSCNILSLHMQNER